MLKTRPVYNILWLYLVKASLSVASASSYSVAIEGVSCLDIRYRGCAVTVEKRALGQIMWEQHEDENKGLREFGFFLWKRVLSVMWHFYNESKATVFI